MNEASEPKTTVPDVGVHPVVRPVVVCLCGSSRFAEHHEEAMMVETLRGHIVIPMGLYGHADKPPGAKWATGDADESGEVKKMLDRLHLAKIDLADEILVVNPGAYVGNSTKREIAYALEHGKRVRYSHHDLSETNS